MAHDIGQHLNGESQQGRPEVSTPRQQEHKAKGQEPTADRPLFSTVTYVMTIVSLARCLPCVAGLWQRRVARWQAEL